MTFEEKFEQISKTASWLIHQKGFSNATLRDISRATGMSLGGLYHYFENKEDLLFRILHTYMEVILSDLEEKLDAIPSAQEKVAFLLQRHIRLYVQYFYESKCLLHEREYLKGKKLAIIKKQERQYFEICRKVLDRLRREAHCYFIHPNVLTFSFFAFVNWIYQWYDPKGRISPLELSRQLSAFFLRGVYGNAKGGSDERKR